MTLSRKTSNSSFVLPMTTESVMNLAPCRIGASFCRTDCGRGDRPTARKRKESNLSARQEFGDDHADPEAAWETMVVDRSRSHVGWTQSHTTALSVGGPAADSSGQEQQPPSGSYVIQIDGDHPVLPSPRHEPQQKFGHAEYHDQSNAHLVQRRNTHGVSAMSPDYRAYGGNRAVMVPPQAAPTNGNTQILANVNPGAQSQAHGGDRYRSASAPCSPRSHIPPAMGTNEEHGENEFGRIEEDDIDLEAQPAMTHDEEIKRLKEQLQITQAQLERTNEDARRIVTQSWRHIDSLEGKLRDAEGSKSLPQYFVEVPFQEVSFGGCIGEGAFGRVYRGLWKGTDVAIKQLSCQHMSETMLADVKNEIQLLSSLRHPNIVLFMGACTVPPNVCILTEFCSRGSLYSLIHSADRELLDLRLIKKIATQVARALYHLHTMTPAVVHRDVKSANILLDESFNARITDFGLARLKAHTQTMTGQVGTIHWMAPEVLASDQYHEKADVYGFGITLSEMVSLRIPYEGMTNMQIGMAVLQQGLRPYLPPHCDPTLASLIQACWHTQQEMRPSFDQVLAWLDRIPA